jgi:hypothetical protein
MNKSVASTFFIASTSFVGSVMMVVNRRTMFFTKAERNTPSSLQAHPQKLKQK